MKCSNNQERTVGGGPKAVLRLFQDGAGLEEWSNLDTRDRGTSQVREASDSRRTCAYASAAFRVSHGPHLSQIQNLELNLRQIWQLSKLTVQHQ